MSPSLALIAPQLLLLLLLLALLIIQAMIIPDLQGLTGRPLSCIVLHPLIMSKQRGNNVIHLHIFLAIRQRSNQVLIRPRQRTKKNNCPVFIIPCCANRSFTLVCHSPKFSVPSNLVTSNLEAIDAIRRSYDQIANTSS